MTETEAATKPSRLRQIPGGIWALGFVSLLMDVSSEMIHALLPVYLVSVLGASMTSVGAIEGIAESTASIVKIFSGALSDWLGRRKFLATLGYGLAALTKPAFPLAQGIDVLIAARFVDRVGKGIRGAPRDALVADIAPPALRGASFGLRQSLDTIGAFLGPALAIGLMWLSADNFKLVFWAAVPPALLAVALLLVAVKEPERHGGAGQLRFPLRFSELARLGGAFWLITLIGTVVALAHFSEAFLILRARDAGLPLALSPLVLVAMNVVYALSAYPAGVLSDESAAAACVRFPRETRRRFAPAASCAPRESRSIRTSQRTSSCDPDRGGSSAPICRNARPAAVRPWRRSSTRSPSRNCNPTRRRQLLETGRDRRYRLRIAPEAQAGLRYSCGSRSALRKMA